MARQRLGVVLLVPQPVATQIDGLRRALGDGALGRIAPHITLVPPVNVADRDMSAALGIVRRAAAATEPLALDLGPVATFAPVNPVAYLAVGGEPEVEASLHDLRAACLSGPLERSTEHDFVPHVTVADDLAASRLAAAEAALGDFRAAVTFDRVHVLAEQPGRVWRPIADALLGVGSAVVGRGSLPLDLLTTGQPDVEAAALLSMVAEPAGLPFAVTARRDGTLVAAAWGWTSGDAAEIADLAVVAEYRGQGIGRHLLAAVEALTARRGCQRLGTSAPAEGAPASLLRGAGFAPVGSDHGRWRRWERAVTPSDERTEPEST